MYLCRIVKNQSNKANDQYQKKFKVLIYMDKIQELTSKLLNEGVEKGRAEADKIISDAKAESTKIVEEAKKEAKQIVASAQKEAAEVKTNTESELKLYASQATEALKSEITNLVTDKLSTSNVKAATEDKAFMQKLISELVSNWAKNESLTIGVENAAELTKYITANAKNLLDKGLKIEAVNDIKTGFVLSPENKSYVVKFSEEEFVEYFREFLRPQIQQLLFW